MENKIDKSYFQPGGSLPANSPNYVKRESDDILFNYLRDGKFCYILTARQMGKSSMRVQVARRLEADKHSCVNIDLTSIGSLDTTSEQWYYSLLNKTCRDLKLPGSILKKWWRDNLDLSPVNRFSSFIEQILLKQIQGSIVIFIDEIDSILSLDRNKFSTDDFFAVIRHCYNSRVDDPEYNRLTFALMGVATPNDLMQDPSRTPFNIGYHVDLESFDFENSMPLLEGLKGLQVGPEKLLKAILNWTCGQPYLTQKICHSLVSNHRDVTDVTAVDHQVEKLFLTEEFEDHNLKNVNNRILLHEKYNIQMLEIVQQLLTGQKIEANDGDFGQIYLKLSGLVKKKDTHLVIRNKIYQNIFNERWLKNAMGKIKRPFAEAMQNWLELGKPKSGALRGEILTQALEWAQNREDITPTENEFLNFSQLIRMEEKEKEIELLYTQRLRTRNRVLVFALFIAIITGLISVYYAFEASKQAKIADEQKNIALMQKIVALNNLKNFKESICSLDQKAECRLELVEFLYKKKDILETLKSTPTSEQMCLHFDDLLKALNERANYATGTDYADIVKLRSEKEDKVSYPIDIKTKSGKTLEDFHVPENLRQNDHQLINLVLRSESMNDDERQYWFNLTNIMSQEQIEKLRGILVRERKRLDEINSNYGRNKEDPKLSLERIIKRLDYISKGISSYHAFHIFPEIDSIKSQWDEKDFNDIELKFFSLKDKFANLHEYYFTLSNLYFCQERLEKAIEYMNHAISEKPNKIKYLERLAEYFTLGKKYDEAQSLYQQMTSMLSNYLQVIDSDKTQFHHASLLMNSGNCFIFNNKNEKAQHVYEKSFNIFNELIKNKYDEKALIRYFDKFSISSLLYEDRKEYKIAFYYRKVQILFLEKLIEQNKSEVHLKKYYKSLWKASFYSGKIKQYKEALDYRRKCIIIIEELLRKDDNNKELLDDYKNCLNSASFYAKKSNNYEITLSYNKKMIKIADNLLDEERNKDNLVFYSDVLGSMFSAASYFKDYTKFLEYAKKSIDIGKELNIKFNDPNELLSNYLNISWYQLENQKFNDSILSSQEGLKIDPEYISLYTNQAHGYLFSNQFEKAKSIYKKYKGKTLEDGNELWNDIIIDDFQNLREVGIFHPKMIDIEFLLDVYIQDIQFLLNKTRDDACSVSNSLDEQTIKAIKLFQKEIGVQVDGKPSAELLNQLILRVYNHGLLSPKNI